MVKKKITIDDVMLNKRGHKSSWCNCSVQLIGS